MAVGSLLTGSDAVHLRGRETEVAYDRKANAVSLEPGGLVLAKADAYRGRRKMKALWDEEPHKVEHQVAEGIPSFLMMNQWTGCS